MEKKICITCETEKSIAEFSLLKPTGKLKNECKICVNERARRLYRRRHGGLTEREKREAVREADPKVCVRCHKPKPLGEFNIHNVARGYHRNFCKECQNEWAKKWRETPDGQEYHKTYNEGHREKQTEYRQIYREAFLDSPELQTKQKDYLRRWGLKNNFGITLEEYEKMLSAQDGKCAICGTDKPYKRSKLQSNFSVDHDHVTGKVRGLLCFRCNTGIGHFQDNIDLMKEAIVYLQSFK